LSACGTAGTSKLSVWHQQQDIAILDAALAYCTVFCQPNKRLAGKQNMLLAMSNLALECLGLLATRHLQQLGNCAREFYPQLVNVPKEIIHLNNDPVVCGLLGRGWRDCG
jgi:hypothetical protein